jgi:hypothetical protein
MHVSCHPESPRQFAQPTSCTAITSGMALGLLCAAAARILHFNSVNNVPNIMHEEWLC